MRDYEELVRQLRKEADKWCTNCCYRAEVFICAAPDDRKKDCDVYTKLQAADAIEELSLVCRTQKAAFDAYIGKTPKWISVEERLPKESGYTIVFCADGDRRHVTFAKYQKTPKRWELSGVRSYWHVLWWMPLPEPPKEDDNA